MAKKKELKLEDFKIKSFITSLDDKEKEIKGGNGTLPGTACNSCQHTRAGQICW